MNKRCGSIEKICVVCGKAYKVSPSEAQRTKYCSKQCVGYNLGKTHGFKAWNMDKNQRKDIKKRMKNLWSNPEWKEKVREAHRGKHKSLRTEQWLEKMRIGARRGWDKRRKKEMLGENKKCRYSRRVWENYWNQRIPNGWDVHHIDGNVSNNDICNLVAMPKKNHLRWHHRKLKKTNHICLICGKGGVKQVRGMCQVCYMRQWRNNLKEKELSLSNPSSI